MFWPGLRHGLTAGGEGGGGEWMAEVDSFHAIRLFHWLNDNNQKMLEGRPPSYAAAARGGKMCPKVGPGGATATAKSWPCQASSPAVITGPGTRPGNILLALTVMSPASSLQAQQKNPTESDFRPSHGKPSSNFASLAATPCVFIFIFRDISSQHTYE